jgi:hypothetical protein
MTDPSRAEPEPIDAEYEPADELLLQQQQTTPRRAGPAPRRMRSRAVTWPHLITASAVSAVAGASVAIIVSNSGASAPTGTLAREIDTLSQTVDSLRAQVGQAGVDVVSLRSRLDAQGDRLNGRDAIEAQMRTDLAALASQVSAISGAGDGAAPEGAAANTTPLGVLLARINRLERVVADATAAPETTREVQRAIADLALQVAELNLANTTLVGAFDRREAALAALETGLQDVATEVVNQRLPAGGGAASRVTLAASDPLAVAAFDATQRAQTIRALSVLDAAARTDNAFADEHRALAALLPQDQDLADIAHLASKGVPTLNSLRVSFDASAARAQRRAEQESDDGWNWLRESFAGTVEFEPSDMVMRNADTLRSARRQLDIGAIRNAVTAVTRLSGGAEQDFATWREKALQRARLDDALKSLNIRLLAAAAAGRGAG